MPLPPKVKTRIGLLSLALLAFVCGGLIIAQDKPDRPGIGELAVNQPQAPTIAPPILDRALPKNTRVKIDLLAQRLYLFVGDEIAINTPISSGRKDLATPTGKFVIAKKELSRKQEDYGNFIDAKGTVVVSGAYRSQDPLPSHLRFQAVTLDHLLTIKNQSFTIHGGANSSLPISTGSVIVPREIAKILFAKVSSDCPVEIIGE